MQDSFSYLGMPFSTLTVIYGMFLMVWGLVVSLLTESSSLTSWIPSFIGVPLFLMGLLTIILPAKAKLFSHIALTVGLLAFLGGLDVVRTIVGGAFMQTPAADVSKVMLAGTGFWYLLVGVKSFRWVRQNRNTNQ